VRKPQAAAAPFSGYVSADRSVDHRAREVILAPPMAVTVSSRNGVQNTLASARYFLNAIYSEKYLNTMFLEAEDYADSTVFSSVSCPTEAGSSWKWN
jgi:hypothetical protein